MVDFPFGAVGAAGAGLIGGIINSQANEVAAGRAQDQANNQLAMQLRFAMHGKTMAARDVMAAYGETGIHPLALLGMQSPSYTPVSYSGTPNTAVGDAITSAGQGVGRAIDAASDSRARIAHAGRLDSLITERAGLENDLLRMRIASEVAQLRNVGPAMPTRGVNPYLVPGQGNTIDAGKVVDQPMKRVGPGSDTTSEPGAVVDKGWAKVGENQWIAIPGKDFQERTEESGFHKFLHAMRNNVLPGIIANYSPPFRTGPGTDYPDHFWSVSPLGQYTLVKRGGTYARIPPPQSGGPR